MNRIYNTLIYQTGFEGVVGLGHLINCNISCDYIIYQITRLQTTCPLGKQSVKVLQPHTREITAIHINIWDSAT